MQVTKSLRTFAKTNPNGKNKLKIELIRTVARGKPRSCGDRDEIVTTPSETIVVVCVISRCKRCFNVLFMVNHMK